MNVFPHHPVLTTLTPADTERIGQGLINEVRMSLETTSSAHGFRASRWRSPYTVGAALIAGLLLVVGLVVLDVGRSPSTAEAMFVVIPKGDWVDISPNLDAPGFDADAAVKELRELGFSAERATYLESLDENGVPTHRAPDLEGMSLRSVGLDFADGTEAMFNLRAPVGAEMPTTADGKMVDWEAAAEQFGLPSPHDEQGNLREGSVLTLRLDAPITIWVLTAP
ncbi:MAG: hypothetical protein WDA77_08555 [Acidimicrobiia bacterium]